MTANNGSTRSSLLQKPLKKSNVSTSKLDRHLLLWGVLFCESTPLCFNLGYIQHN